MNLLAVGAGGAVGAVCRYLLGQVLPTLGSGFPLGTFVVNLIGCFAIGLIAGFAGRQGGLEPRLVLLLQAGVCGGFTTFSTFSLEALSLIEEGEVGIAFLYIGLSVLFGILSLLGAKVFVHYVGVM